MSKDENALDAQAARGSAMFVPSRRAVLIGGAATLAASRSVSAQTLATSEHYQLQFFDKARRRFVALINVDPQNDRKGQSGPQSSVKDAEEANKLTPADVQNELGKRTTRPNIPKYLLLWDRREFGPNALFQIERTSAAFYPDGKPALCPTDCEKSTDAKTAVWLPVCWTLTVHRASFPGNEAKEFTLTFKFERNKETFGPWCLRATMSEWWLSQESRISAEFELNHFLTMPNSALAFSIAQKKANRLLESLFGKRIEAETSLKLKLDRDLKWTIKSDTGGQLFILDIPLEFGGLALTRIRGDAAIGSSQMAAGGESATDAQTDAKSDVKPPNANRKAASRFLFDGEVIDGRLSQPSKQGSVDGLYGAIDDIKGFTAPKPVAAKSPARRPLSPALNRIWTFDFATMQSASGIMTVSLALDEAGIAFDPASQKNEPDHDRKVLLKAAIRHWGYPALTVAGCVAEPREIDGRRDAVRGIGRVSLNHGKTAVDATEGPFELCGFQIVRQQRGDQVLTRLRGEPCEKETTANLRIGDVCVAALPTISARPGAAPQRPMIVVEAREKRDAASADQRRLTAFSGRLALVSAAVALPERIVPATDTTPTRVIAGPHVTSLQFTDTDVEFYVPALTPAPISSADAVIPLGPVVESVTSVTIHLGRARLSVIRPNDLLALKFRFAGLELVTPWPPSRERAAQLMPPGSRATGRSFAPQVRSDGAPRDERPLLVVEFPPQHVVERAFFKRLPPLLDLPELTSADQAVDAAQRKASLLGPKGWTGKKPDAAMSVGAAVQHLIRCLCGNAEAAPGSAREQRMEWRKQLRTLCGWPGASLLFPNAPTAPGLAAKTMKDFDDAFVARAKADGLPEEQSLYAGADFLDPDARRIALRVLSDLRSDQVKPSIDPPWPAVVLTPSDWSDLFKPLIKANVSAEEFKIPAQTPVCRPDDPSCRPDEPIWPDRVAIDNSKKGDPLRAVMEEIELARERIDRDYAAFRARYRIEARRAATTLRTGAPAGSSKAAEWFENNADYFGRAWLTGVVALPPTDVLKADFNAFIEALKNVLRENDQDEILVPKVEARLSGPSRIAFRIDCDDFESDRAVGRLPFTVEGLTNWGSMDMAVVRRAERLMEPLPGGARLPPRWGRRALNDEAAILRFQGFTSSRQWGPQSNGRRAAATSAVTPNQRLAEVYASSMQPPDLFQTAIELPFRLFLSPAQDATWMTAAPRVRRDAGYGDSDLSLFRELWSARLSGLEETAGVRAVWSPDYRPEALLSTKGAGAPPIGPYAPWALPRGYGIRKPPIETIDTFRTGLESFDRHELVALTSVHGLPVLGRRAPSGDLTLDSNQIEPPDGFRLQGLFQETIPEKQQDMVRPINADMTAIYRPKALSVSELSLTALGGNLDIDGAFQPPASARGEDGNNLFDALSVERWRQRTVLGRDILVEVVYKGFLFPIGHRASLVKLTERRFEYVDHRQGPVAVLIQRLFLKIGNPEKRFMAEGQPNRGSRWPCDRVMMLTRQSPDLVDARSDQSSDAADLGVLARGRIAFKDEKGVARPGLCMWPRTSARRGAEVWFEMQIGDEPTPVRMPLIFVDNIAANDAGTMEALIKYYAGNTTVDEGGVKRDKANVPDLANVSPTRRMMRNAQAVVMAPEDKPGDTTFETEWWRINAEGRQKQYPVKTDSGFQFDNTDYIRTSFMEGQDQPAFYPVVERAHCRLKAVERFTGSGPLWADVIYDGEYVAKGFAKPLASTPGKDQTPSGDANSDIYLRIAKSDDADGEILPLDFKERGDLAGGVARPTMDVIAISRTLGPINRVVEKPKLDRDVGPRDAKADKPVDDNDLAKGILPALERVKRFSDSINIVPKGRFLGIMDLCDLVEKLLGVKLHPKLTNLIEYGAASALGAAADAAGDVRSVLVKALIAPGATAVAAVQQAWRTLASKRINPAAKPGAAELPNLENVYPQVGADIARLKELLDAAQNPEIDDIAFFAGLASIYEAARRLGRTIDNIARDPLAAAASAQLELLTQITKSFEDFNEAFVNLRNISALGNAIVSQVSVELGAIIAEHLKARLEGRLTGTALAEAQNIITNATASLVKLSAFSFSGLNNRPADIVATAIDAARRSATPSKPVDDAIVALVDHLRAIQAAADDLKDETSRTLAAETVLPRSVVFAIAAIVRLQEAGFVSSTMPLKWIDQPPLSWKTINAYLRALAQIVETTAEIILARAEATILEGVTGFCAQATLTLEEAAKGLLPSTTAFEDTGLDDVADAVGAAKKALADLDLTDRAKEDFALVEAKNLALKRAIFGYRYARQSLDTATAKMTRCSLPLPDISLLPADIAVALSDVVTQQRLVFAAIDALAEAARKLVANQFSPERISQMIVAGLAPDDIEAGFKTMTALLKTALGKLLPLSGLGAILPATQFNDLADQMRKLRDVLAASFPETAAAIEQIAARLKDKAAQDYRDRKANFESALKAIENASPGNNLSAAAADAFQQYQSLIQILLDDLSKAFAGDLRRLLADAAATALPRFKTVYEQISKPIAGTLKYLDTAYTAIVGARDGLKKRVDAETGVVASVLDELAREIGLADRRALFEVPPGPPNERLAEEAKLVRSAAENWTSNPPPLPAATALRDLALSYREKPALGVLAERVDLLTRAFFRILIVEALDLRALRRELDRIVRELVPTRALLSYTLVSPVRKFGLPGVGDIFLPVKDTKLDIRMQGVVDLIEPSRSGTRIDGRMGPFGIQLFGSFDVVLLNFLGMEFRSGTGQPSGFDVRFGDFVIGEKAKFLKQLEPYVSPKCGLPPVRLMRDKPGIEATYGVNLGSFGVGALSFSNVTLNAGARLPFGNDEAEFIVSIGRSDAPFLISSTVFGGGGYLALLANGKGFIGLETSFDYGGVFTFGFGPLSGTGQITLGLYFRAVRGEPARLGMNFMARGAASIACFSFSTSLFVRLTYANNKMDGRATYSFSFSLGIDDIDFTFEVYVDQGGNAGSGRPTSAFLDMPGQPSLTRFAGTDTDTARDPRDAYAQAAGPGCPAPGSTLLRVQAPSPKSNWTAYHALFDDALDPVMPV